MIQVKNGQFVMKGEIKDIIDELKDLREDYGDITMDELIKNIQEKWK